MRLERSRWTSAAGPRLSGVTYWPEEDPRGGVLMMHGLGDYVERYEHVARFFCERGYVVMGTDWPGSGRSEGIRGHIPGGFATIRDVIDSGVARLREVVDDVLPLGAFAHSMGGFALLDYLPDRRRVFRFAWLSSPLLNPANRRAGWLLRVLPVAARLAPWFPIDTGVRAEDCRPAPFGGEDPALFHHWVSASLGHAMVQRQPLVESGLERFPPDLEVLVTHGTADPVCPFEGSERLVDRLPPGRVALVPVEGGLHEPLHGPEARKVLEATGRWLDDLGLG